MPATPEPWRYRNVCAATSFPFKRNANRSHSLLANATEQFSLGHARLLPKSKHICCGVTEIIKGLLKIPQLCLALIGSSANERLCVVPGVPALRSLGAS